jgi:hypothetical protein
MKVEIGKKYKFVVPQNRNFQTDLTFETRSIYLTLNTEKYSSKSIRLVFGIDGDITLSGRVKNIVKEGTNEVFYYNVILEDVEIL